MTWTQRDTDGLNLILLELRGLVERHRLETATATPRPTAAGTEAREEVCVTDYTKPRPGDKVRATLPTVDGVLVAADGQGVQLRLDDGSIHHLPGADIHMLERADDPSEDPIGTVRREKHEEGFSVWLASLDYNDDRYWVCVYSTAPGNRGQVLEDRYVWDTEVVSSLWGTPAAEAETREKSVSVAVLREKIRREEDKQARRDASWSVSPGVEIEQALQQRNAPAQGPEFWIGDGSEEPPHSVRKVADAAGDYLTRSGDDWVGDGGNGYAAKAKPWVDHILPKYAPYTEVSS
jgi:hypothetical protein